MASTFSTDLGLIIQPHEVLGLNRMYVEHQRLLQKFPGFSLVATGERIGAAAGYLTTNYGTRYGIRIEIPSVYPYELPAVWPAGWTLASGTPHSYIDGRICILRSSQWNDKFTIAFCVAKTAIWLNKYDYWRRNGVWPGLGQAH